MNLSYSGLEVLHTCPRKFELEKARAPEIPSGESSLDLVAGSAFGSGFAHYLLTGNLEAAHWEAYKRWTFPDGINKPSISIYEASKKKSFHLISMHLQKYAASNELAERGWSVWTLPNGKPAIEVGFRIALPNGYYYRGFIDAILQHYTGKLTALEVKTSGFKDAHIANWQNSFQGMSYALIVDLISGQSFEEQLFFIAEFPDLGQQILDFWRGPLDKYSWLPALALDIQHIETYKRTNHFPMRGSSCFNYFRPCPHLGTCNLKRTVPYVNSDKEDKPYDFEFTLAELLDFSKAKLN